MVLKRKRSGVGRWLGLSAAVFLVAGAAAAGPSKISTAEDRREVTITVYNQNFGLVREVREIDIGTGTVPLEFRDVAVQMQPETVHIKSAAGAAALSVLEQNYRYDLLSPATLLQKFVGKKVRVHRYIEKTGKDETHEAELLSVADGRPVLKINGEITFDYPGRLSFPKVPDNLIAKPTLVWMLESKKPKQRVEVTYLARALNWRADYVLVVNEDDTRGDLTGWVTLTNQSGASYKNAQLKLVAGDVNRVSRPSSRSLAYASKGMTAGKKAGFSEESLFEYHLYSLQRPTDVLNKEQKQVSLLEASNIGIQKRLMFYGQQYWYRSRHGSVMSNQKVGVYLDLKNSKQNGLGMPLPKGTVRVYKADKSGAQQFIGEDNIDHTPKDERVRVKMGEAFDVVGDRKQMSWKPFGRCVSESTWEIELRNHKDKAVVVQDFEPIGGDWKVLESSHPHKRKDANTFTFEVRVPANGKTKIKYRVRVRWC